MWTANGKVPHTRTERIAYLQKQRGYFAGLGQAQKVKAVDVEIAKLRQQDQGDSRRSGRVAKRGRIETAEADLSSTESAALRSA